MYYFIVNLNSRSGQAEKVWRKAERILKEKTVDYQVYFTEYIGHARALSRQVADMGVPCVLGILGGDGTLNEAVNGLMDGPYEHVALGYIPSGSGNDFARGLGLPTEPEVCMEHILHPRKTLSIDLGKIKTEKEQRYFAVSTGFGYDAEICRQVSLSSLKKLLNKIHMGKLIYVVIALRILLGYQPSTLKARLEKKEVHCFPGTFFLAAMNLKYEGGGVKFCPDALYNDGKLDICVAAGLSRLKILALFPTAFLVNIHYLKAFI